MFFFFRAIRCRSSAKQQSYQSARPPLRVLVLPGGENMCGALAVNIGRHLADRGSACVLLYAPPSSSPHQSNVESVQFPTYADELTLAQTLAPRATTLLSTEVKEAGEDVNDDSDEEEDEEEMEEVKFGEDGDLEVTSPAGRMWISRIPGLTVVSRPGGIIRRPKNALIDLLILGQALELYPVAIHQWLLSHKAICLALQLGSKLKAASLKEESVAPPQALKTWIVQLGMPVFSPAQIPELMDVQLVDVGMSRSIVSRVTGNLRGLPPPALFDSTSCIQLSRQGSCSV